MRRWCVRVTLSLVLGLGVMAGLVRADSGFAVIQAPPFESLPPGLEPLPDGAARIAPIATSPRRSRLRTYLGECFGVGCYATHLDHGCSSFKAEATFVFGSCRQFFGGACQPAAPPPPFLLPYHPYNPACNVCR